jgi:hypothetical protein
MVSQPEDGGSKVLRNIGILPHHYTVSQPEDGDSKVLRNIGILPHHYMVSQPKTNVIYIITVKTSSLTVLQISNLLLFSQVLLTVIIFFSFSPHFLDPS